MSNSSSYSGDFDSSSEAFSEEILDGFAEEGILPYQFEPEVEVPASESSDDSAESDSDTSDQEPERLQNSNWCTCGSCQVMDRIEECVCCQEIDRIRDMCQNIEGDGVGLEPVPCITQHPGFLPVCTNKYVLSTAWMQYKQQYNEPYDGPEHKKYRHIAYRQLARWCWGFLGKEVRVVLPSCAVMCIRQHFPPPGLEEDFVFEGFHYADE